MERLLKGDCLYKFKEIEDDSVDMVLTDPPYGSTASKWDIIIPFEPMWKELKRISKKNICIALFGSEPFSSSLRVSNIDWYKYDWIWEKGRSTGYVHAKNKPLKIHENISIFSSGTTIHKSQSKNRMNYFPQMKGGNPYKKKAVTSNAGNIIHSPSKSNIDIIGSTKINLGDRYPNSVIKFTMHNVGNYHPNQKPVKLIEYLIKIYTKENNTVLDFAMGSGTTGVACKRLNRNFIGIEKDTEIYKIAEKRISEVISRKEIFTFFKENND